MNDITAGRLVARQIHRLVGDGGRTQMSPSSQAMLAQLRRGIGRPPGAVPEIWSVTLADIPDSASGAERVRLENAVHLGLTHFALHQQSRDEVMHVQGKGFGTAIRDLARMSSQKVHETPVYRRFVNMAATTQLSAVMVHARGLITQLRGDGIGFDYAAFADQLADLQIPSRADRVRRTWGRDFHRPIKPTAETQEDTITEGDPS